MLPDALVEAPDRAGYVVGLRLWTRGPRNLESPYLRSPWLPGRVFRAWCRLEGLRVPREVAFDDDDDQGWGEYWYHEKAPDGNCSCGVYALVYWFDLITEQMRVDQRPVFGAVALWGPIVRHERGWRGRFAYPVALFGPPPRWGRYFQEWYDEPAVEALARAYGVPYLPWGSPEVELTSLGEDA